MKTETIEKRIVDQFGGKLLLNIKEATAVLGFKDRTAAKNFLKGVPVVDMGKEKKYLAADIARRIAGSIIYEE